MRHILRSIYLWFDTSAPTVKTTNSINWLRCIPYIAIYVGCLGVFWVGISATTTYVCIAAYCMNIFFVTGFYHRYCSHRAYKTSRIVQFIFTVLAMCSAQRCPLWWAAHHRFHHKHSDTILDNHSPIKHGFIRSHWAWFLEDANFATNEEYIKDLMQYPELVFLNRFDSLPPLVFASLLYYFGGLPILVWGFFIPTVLAYQVTFAINSLSHLIGVRRYETNDNSRNNWWLAILSFGEGWHNNHHHYPSSAKQGFRIHEIDITYLILKLLQTCGLIWDLRVPSPEVIDDTIVKKNKMITAVN